MPKLSKKGKCCMKDEGFRKLMGKAAEDLNLLRVGCENMGISDAIFGFHAQQTVEKIFKAWICLNGKEYPFTHDLRLLYNLLAKTGAEGLDKFIDLVEFTDYAVDFRYDFFGNDESLDRHQIFESCFALFNNVNQISER